MPSLYKAFENIKSEKEFDNFLRDLCTPAEIKNLGERWRMAQMLYTTNMPQDAIAQKIGGSQATVTRVARFLYEEKFGGYKSVLSRLFPIRAEILAKKQIGRLTASSRRHHA
jgi:TrpR-related protein YerC/YecD